MPLDHRIAGLGDQAVDYLAAWELQREVHEAVVSGAQGDTVLLLEHPPVFTCGKRTDPHERPLDPVAPRSSTSTAGARSPSTVPASWSATRSCGSPTTSRSSTTYAGSRRP